jgi:hypothetical protein
VGLRAGLDVAEKNLLPLPAWNRTPARSRSVCRMSYPGSQYIKCGIYKDTCLYLRVSAALCARNMLVI